MMHQASIMLVLVLVLLTAVNGSDVCLTYGGESWLGMLSWVSAGASPRWVVQDGGKTVHQYVNSPYPGFYVSDDDDLINIVVTGTVEIQSVPGIKEDDDFIGISVGHKYPLPGADTMSKFDTMLFSWGGQGAFGDHAEATFQKLNGSFTWDYTNPTMPDDCYYCFFARYSNIIQEETIRQDHGCFTAANTSHGKSGGWALDTVNTFALLFTDDLFQIKINNKLTFNMTPSDLDSWCTANTISQEHAERCRGGWRKGRIAWYNFSQNGVIYGNIRMFRVQPKSQISNSTGEAPKIVSDFYTIKRVSGNLIDTTIPFYEGILKNDHSPELLDLSIFISSNGSSDIEIVNSEGTNFKTYFGNNVWIQPSGAFNYSPPAGVTEASEDYFEYYVLDSKGRKSFQKTARVTFALPPVISSGFKIMFAAAEEVISQRTDWFSTLTKGTQFGNATATSGCGAIADWTLSNGGAQGRFSLNIVSDGAQLVVADPNRLTPHVIDTQLYNLNITATDIYGQVSFVIVSITIPAINIECEPNCEGNSTCEIGVCRCTNSTLQYPDCDVAEIINCVPACSENQTCSILATCECSSGYLAPNCTLPERSTEPPAPASLSCTVFEVGGRCLGWLVIVFLVVLILFFACCGYVYTHRGVHTTNKKKGGKMKSYELDSRYLEGLQ